MGEKDGVITFAGGAGVVGPGLLMGLPLPLLPCPRPPLAGAYNMSRRKGADAGADAGAVSG